MKKMKRLMAWVLTIAMMAGMFSIETKKAEAAEVKDTYELVTPTKDASGNWVLPEDGEYVIVYALTGSNGRTTYYALTKGTSGDYKYEAIQGSVNSGVFTPNSVIEENNLLWRYKNGFTLSSDSSFRLETNKNPYYIKKNNNKDDSFSLSTSTDDKQETYLYYYSSVYYGDYWAAPTTSTTNSSYEYFKFYKKVIPVTLTVEWYLDEKLVAGPEALPALAGHPIPISKPDVVSGEDVLFEKGAYEDGSAIKSEPASLTIQEDRTVRLYYKSKYPADDLLYPDDVLPEDGEPVYPDPGAVALKKSAESDDFKGTGVAKVELSTVGVPIRKGVDIILLLDNSASMKNTEDSSRLADLQEKATDFTEKVLGDNEDGSKSNNRLALVTFAGFSNKKHTSNYNPWNDENNYKDGYYGNNVLCPLKNAESKNAIINMINSWTNDDMMPGTDYDYPFQKAREILKLADPSREKFVVFLTDGAPSKYNGVVWVSNETDTALVHAAINTATKEAIELINVKTIKADPKTKVYSVGFEMNWTDTEAYNGFTSEEGQKILKKIATDETHYLPADKREELQQAFDKIAMDIRSVVGTDAVVTDKIANLFELQKTKTLPNGKPPLPFDPTIEVKIYNVYTQSDIGKVFDGKVITEDDLGKRKSVYEEVEKITFTNNGNGAKSDKLPDKNNIMDKDGNIYAKYFTYYAVATPIVDPVTGEKKTIEPKTFLWNVGDITDREAVISYYVYLNGSMEGKRGDGIYDTNEYAHLDYTNIDGGKIKKPYEEPKMPWGLALVNYEYYLVNAEGKPVNIRGEVIEFDKRHRVGDVQQKKVNWNSTTDVSVQLSASESLPNGYTLHIPDAAYTANAMSSGKGSHIISGNGETTTENRQSSTVMYRTDESYTNSYVAFGILYEKKLIPDAVVVDYGLPVTIDVMENDLIHGAALQKIGLPDANVQNAELGKGTTVGISKDFKDSVNLTNGFAKVTEDGKVCYTPTKYMDRIERFLYAANEPKANSTIYRYEKVSVIPATSVYYEDNFGNTQDEDKGSKIVFSGDWKTEGTYDTGREQDNGTTAVDQHPYGHDSHYKNDDTFSGGSAHVVEGTPNTDTTAFFTFKGTGFDIISRTDQMSTSIAVKVVDSAGKTVSMKFLDNKYAAGTLYQIPVYEWRAKDFGKGYGEYTVTIIVGQSDLQNQNCTFYLDAIRVYNPIDPESDDGKEAEKYYVNDRESNETVTELRKSVIDEYKGGKELGFIYVDGEDISEIGKYHDVGPNNEIYLKPNQSIGVDIEPEQEVETVQISAKAPVGAVKFKVGSDSITEREFTVDTATDMYYDITDTLNFLKNEGTGKKSAKLVVTNTSEEKDMILSLTHMKITYKEPSAKAALTTDEAVVMNTLRVTKNRMAANADKKYTVIVDGVEKGKYDYNALVTLSEADIVRTKENLEFAGWEVNGAIVSETPDYKFYVSSDVTIQSVFKVHEEEVINKKTEAILETVLATKRSDGKSDVKFVGQLVVPEGYQLVNAGLVWSTKFGTVLSLESDLKPTYITQISNTNQFSVTIKGLPKDMFIRGKIFATFENLETHEVETVYSKENMAFAQ